jgi:hypothetical protein
MQQVQDGKKREVKERHMQNIFVFGNLRDFGGICGTLLGLALAGHCWCDHA